MRARELQHSIWAETVSGIYEITKREYERMRHMRDLEIEIARLNHMYSTPSYRVDFSHVLLKDEVVIIDDVIYAPESKAYQFIFMNGNVNDNTIKIAINHATKKIHRFIDNYKS